MALRWPQKWGISIVLIIGVVAALTWYMLSYMPAKELRILSQNLLSENPARANKALQQISTLSSKQKKIN